MSAAPLARRNPAVKLAVLVAVSVATLFLYDPVPLAVLFLLAFAGVWAGTRMPLRRLAVAQVPFLLFGAGLVAINVVTRPDGLSIGAALALRALVVGTVTVGFLVSTTPRDLMVSLVRQVRLSPRFAYAILAGHRMLDAMPARWSAVRAAQAVRAPLRRDGRPRSGPRDFGRAAFALLVMSIRASERVALALESRGLRDGPRTVWQPVPLDRRDAVLPALVLLSFVVVLTADAWVR